MVKMGKRKQIQNEPQKNPKKTKKDVVIPAVVSSDEPVERQKKWTNKQRTLIFSSRGISYRTRHLMMDLKTLMAHSKTEPKMDRKDKLLVINEICEMKNCNKCLYFEGKKKQDLYLWASNVPKGPSAKFLVENHHTKSQPFYDHVFTFSIQDNRIWFRNYQILSEDGSLAEIGPRFVLNPIRIFSGSFGGATLYQNPSYISPNELRQAVKRAKGYRYSNQADAKMSAKARKMDVTYDLDPTDQVFHTITESELKK